MPYYPPSPAGGTTLPVADTQTIVTGSGDATKQVRFEVDGLTAGQTRVVTVPDNSLTMAGLDVSQTFTASQTYQASALVGSGTVSVGSSGVGVFVLGNSTAPTTAPADEVQLFCSDYAAGDARLLVYSETGAIVWIGNGAVESKTPASGAGNSLSLNASSAVSGNTAGGNVVLQPGLKSGSGENGRVVVRQPSGVAGEDEFHLYYEGDVVKIKAETGTTEVQFIGPFGTLYRFDTTAGSRLDFVTLYGGGAQVNQSSFSASRNNQLGWCTGDAYNTVDVGLTSNAAGVARVTNGSTGAGSLIVGSSTASIGSSGVGVFVLGNSTAPTTAPADEVQLYCADVSAGNAALHVYGEGTDALVARGRVTVRQVGGVVGTDEILISHDGTHAYLSNSDTGGVRVGVARGGATATNKFRVYRVELDTRYVDIDPDNGVMVSSQDLGLGANSGSGKFIVQATNLTIRGVSYEGDTGFRRAAAGVLQLCDDTSTNPAGLAAIARTPAQITADQNNYSPGVGMVQRWSSDASRNITGLAAGQSGETRFVWNVGSQDIVLQNENASSSAANRLLTSTGADVTLSANKAALAVYDTTSARWRVTLLP